MDQDIDRRLTKIESEQDKMEETLQTLVLSTQRMADVLENQKEMFPQIAELTRKVHKLEISMSNAALIQRGVVWLGSIIGSSGVIMALSFLFGAK